MEFLESYARTRAYLSVWFIYSPISARSSAEMGTCINPPSHSDLFAELSRSICEHAHRFM